VEVCLTPYKTQVVVVLKADILVLKFKMYILSGHNSRTVITALLSNVKKVSGLSVSFLILLYIFGITYMYRLLHVTS
jgi:hypothetical protein